MTIPFPPINVSNNRESLTQSSGFTKTGAWLVTTTSVLICLINRDRGQSKEAIVFIVFYYIYSALLYLQCFIIYIVLYCIYSALLYLFKKAIITAFQYKLNEAFMLWSQSLDMLLPTYNFSTTLLSGLLFIFEV